eukprot:TRINITY_DN40018_c0_g1_i1.p1 TRINITY_DN40018_c0_g1~~TRINITY_DN40018_c0_g1_i1.p1  ORF type:complete len:325 (+),score=66.27 TRINITY_DN40018_c0_g1_i1:84-1058(+)
MSRLASVIVPTVSSRQRFHSSLYRSFLAQRWERREMVVVETGASPSTLLQAVAAVDQRVKYVYLGGPESSASGPQSIGAKRNAAIERSEGSLVVHFDDDDVYSPDYITRMARVLAETGADLVKLQGWHTLDVETGVCGYFDGGEPLPLEGAERLRELARDSYGFSFVYTRELYRRAGPFPPVSFGEDHAFLTAARSRGYRVERVGDEGCTCLRVQHGGNLSRIVAHRTVALSDLYNLPIGAYIPRLSLRDGAQRERGVFVCRGSNQEEVERLAMWNLGEEGVREDKYALAGGNSPVDDLRAAVGRSEDPLGSLAALAEIARRCA